MILPVGNVYCSERMYKWLCDLTKAVRISTMPLDVDNDIHALYYTEIGKPMKRIGIIVGTSGRKYYTKDQTLCYLLRNATRNVIPYGPGYIIRIRVKLCMRHLEHSVQVLGAPVPRLTEITGVDYEKEDINT